MQYDAKLTQLIQGELQKQASKPDERKLNGRNMLSHNRVPKEHSSNGEFEGFLCAIESISVCLVDIGFGIDPVNLAQSSAG